MLVEALEKDISVKRSERNYIVDVDVRAGTPDKAEKLAQGLADAYFASQAELADQAVAKQSAWLDERLSDLRAGSRRPNGARRTIAKRSRSC